MADMMQQRRDTAANWQSANPILGAGQVAYVTDTKPWKSKTGDGVTAWNALPFNEIGGSDSVKVLAAIGDSETACYPYYPSETVYPTMEQDIANASSWTNVIRKRTGMTVYNRGIGGQTTAELLARFDTDVLAVNPDYVIMEGMINDIVKPDKAVSAAGTQANFEVMIAKCTAAGVVPIVAISAPLQVITGVTAGNVSDYQARIATLKTYCTNNGIEVLDFYNLFIQNIVGGVISSLIYTDNLHPNTAGYLRMGEYAVYRLKQFVPEFKIAQSPLEDFLRHDASGTSPNLGYKTGDVDFEKAPSLGGPLFWACINGDTNTWAGTGHLRNGAAPTRCYFLATGDTTDYYWDLDDICFYQSTPYSMVLYQVTKAGWSNVHSVASERATFTEKATIPIGSAPFGRVFYSTEANPDVTTLYPAGAIVYFTDVNYAYMTFTSGYSNNSSLSPKGTWCKITNI